MSISTPNTTRKWGYFPDGEFPLFRRIKGNLAELLEDFVYIDKNNVEHKAQKGLIYDGGSTPKPTRGITAGPWDDDMIGPATIHDWYCKLGREGVSPYPSSHVHRLFYEMLKCLNVHEIRARARYLVVYNFGPRFKAIEMPITRAEMQEATEDAKTQPLRDRILTE